MPIPELSAEGPNLSDWWIRSWEPSYREIGLDDFGSVEELATIVYDSGAQLGAGSVHLPGKRWTPPCSSSRWPRSPVRRAPRRAVNLVEQMLRAWDRLAATQGFTRSK